MPGYFAPSSPWEQAAGGIGAAGDSIARVALNLATMKAQRQYQMQEMAIRQAQLAQEDRRLSMEQDAQNMRAPLLSAQTDEAKANTGRIGAETEEKTFDTKSKEARSKMADNVRLLMGALRSPKIGAVMRDPQSGPSLVAALRASGVVPEGGFETSDAELPDLIKAALPAQVAGEAMQQPGSAERLMQPAQLRPGVTPQDMLTGDRGTAVPPVPEFRGFGRGGILNARTGDVVQDSEPYPTPANSQLSPNAALGALRSDMWPDIMQQYPGIASLVTNTLMRGQAPAPQPMTNAPAGPAVTSKTLDKNNPQDLAIAKKFLSDAGGDANKARQLAKAAGFNF